MATSSFAASSILLPFTTNPKSPHLFASFPCKNNTLLPSLRLRPISASASAASIPTPSVQVDNSPPSAAPSKVLPFRVGHGFDLHRLEPGYPLIIGGINIPHEKGCEAHSDGDVLLHCVVDAILGALGLPDIGQIFPDSDPKWKGCDSSVFIKESVSIIPQTCLLYSTSFYLSLTDSWFGHLFSVVLLFEFNSFPWCKLKELLI